MSSDVVVDFNVLPRATRERIIASTSQVAMPPRILEDKDTGGSFVPWLLCGLLGLGLLGMVFFSSFGRYHESFIQGSGFAIVPYAMSICLVTAAALGIVYDRKRKAALPYTPGRYLFPLDIVELRQGHLRIRSLSDLTGFKATHEHSNGSYTHTSFVFAFPGGTLEQFRVSDKRQAEQRLMQLKSLREEFARALERQDASTLERLDLFFNVRTQGGFEAFQNKAPRELDGGPRASVLPGQLGRRWGIALVAGLVLGGAVLVLRNLTSDVVAFSSAKDDGRADAFLNYLRVGRLYVEEAKQFGADAQFAQCTQTDTERCWTVYVKRWTGSPRFKEVQDERLPRAALKESSHSVTALRGFRERYPNSVVDGEAKDLLHGLFSKSLTEFESQASTGDARLLPFIGRLLTHLEATNSPRVLLRFRQEPSPTLAKADKILDRAMREEGKQMASVARHFEPQYTQPLESAIASAMGSAFKQIFPTDLLALELAPPGQEASGDLPVMDIVYTIGWSGATYSEKDSRRVYVGIQFDFEVDMSVPGEKPMSFELRVSPPEHFTVQFTRAQWELVGMAGSGPSDDAVYRVMALRAFDELNGKLRNVFFRKDSKAFQASALGGAE